MGKYAMVLVSALIFSVITYSHALRNALFISNTRTVETFSHNQAHNIAQSAAMIAINSLQNEEGSPELRERVENLDIGSEDIYPSAGIFETWSDMKGGYNLRFLKESEDAIVIQSTGRFDETEYRTTIRLERVANTPVFNQALHAEDSIEMGGSDYVGCVDGTEVCQVTLNSNSPNSINLIGSTLLDSDLFIGPGGDIGSVITGSGEEKISGNVGLLSKRIDFPPPDFPDFNEVGFSPQEGISYKNTSTVLQPHEYHGKHIDQIVLSQGNNTLTIHTGNDPEQTYKMRVGSLILGGQNKIDIEGEGKVEFYVDHEVDMKGGSSINKDGTVDQLYLFYKGFQEVELYDETLDFGGNTVFNGSFFADQANIRLRGTAGIQGNVTTNANVSLYGDAEAISRLIYAPTGTVSASGNVKIKGAVISHKFIGSGNTSLIYDPEFDAVPPPFSGTKLQIVMWN